MKITILSKGRIILPADLCRKDDIRRGQQFQIERINRGEYRLTRKALSRNTDLVKLLLSCPVKDWFEPLNRSETINDI